MFGFVRFTDGPSALLQQVFIVLPIFLLSITLHEFAHAATASALGDPTARNAGRVTLNPVAHLDVLGTLMILFGPIGWAKPVPIDERYLGRWGSALVGLAGPLANLFLATVGLIYLKHSGLAGAAASSSWLVGVVTTLFYLNVSLAVFNLLPIPPLDGSQIFRGLLPPAWRPGYYQVLPYGVVILLAMIWLPAGGAMLDHLLQLATAALEKVVP
ncbi:MAG: site-2 protease family protein [Cyanobacteria bacterium REEB65]|nr:site-2 protease family protein [Cyanobacteria bacterium REEB65]